MQLVFTIVNQIFFFYILARLNDQPPALQLDLTKTKLVGSKNFNVKGVYCNNYLQSSISQNKINIISQKLQISDMAKSNYHKSLKSLTASLKMKV